MADLRIQQIFGQILLDDALGLAEAHAGDIDRAVAAQADGAVGTNQVLAAKLLHAAELSEGDGDLGVPQDIAQVVANAGLDLIERHAADAHGAVVEAKVDRAFGRDHERSIDRLVRQGVGDVDKQDFQRLDAVRRLGHQTDSIDRDDVRRGDGVGRMRHRRQFRRNGSGAGDRIARRSWQARIDGHGRSLRRILAVAAWPGLRQRRLLDGLAARIVRRRHSRRHDRRTARGSDSPVRRTGSGPQGRRLRNPGHIVSIICSVLMRRLILFDAHAAGQR